MTHSSDATATTHTIPVRAISTPQPLTTYLLQRGCRLRPPVRYSGEQYSDSSVRDGELPRPVITLDQSRSQGHRTRGLSPADTPQLGGVRTVETDSLRRCRSRFDTAPCRRQKHDKQRARRPVLPKQSSIVDTSHRSQTVLYPQTQPLERVKPDTTYREIHTYGLFPTRRRYWKS